MRKKRRLNVRNIFEPNRLSDRYLSEVYEKLLSSQNDMKDKNKPINEANKGENS